MKSNLNVFDVLIIGGGVGGLTAGQRYAEKGLAVAVLNLESSANKFTKFSSSEILNCYKDAGFLISWGKTQVVIGEAMVPGGGSAVNSGLIQRATNDTLNRFERDYDISNWSEKIRDYYYTEAEKLLSIEQSSTQTGQGQLLKIACASLNWKSVDISKVKANEAESNLNNLLQDRIISKGGKFFFGEIKNFIKANHWEASYVDAQNRIEMIKAKKVIVALGASESSAFIDLNFRKKLFGISKFKAHLFNKILVEDESRLKNINGVDSLQIKQFSPEISLGCAATNRFLKDAYIATHSLKTRGCINLDNAALYYSMTTMSGSMYKLRSKKSSINFNSITNEDIKTCTLALEKLIEVISASKPEKIVLPCQVLNRNNNYRLQQSIGPKDLALSTVHIMAGLSISGNKNSLVDSFGLIKDIPDLACSDASLIPDCIGVNPQLTVMALALRVADNF